VNFIAEVMKKPWLHEPAGELNDGPLFPVARPTLGFRIFLVIVGFLFTLMVGAFADRLVLGDWLAMPEPWTLWLNTAFLLASSVALSRASKRLDSGAGDLKALVIFGVVVGIAFVIGQLAAWMQLLSQGYLASANPAYAFFYMLTGAHAVHVLGGLGVLVNLAFKLGGGAEPGRLGTALRLCAAYWHFLLIVWFVLFALLLFT